jgi:alpha-ribazole phosphatase
MEMDFGSWEGVRWDAVPRGELDAWADDVWHYRPGGAESAALVAERWLRWSAMLRRPESGTAVDTAVGTAVGAAVGTAVGTAAGTAVGTAVAVTHAGLIRVALRCAGLSSAAAFSQAVVDYGSVHRIELEDEWVSA